MQRRRSRNLGEVRKGGEAPLRGIVEQMDATTLLLPGDVARVDPLGNLVIEYER
ncbi:MAG TPA: hypothetical protein VGT40_00340 [Methylomirabilota bacterium]|jgi:hypothetical protein|nr:hypothetical protein [Methylomirabilota bacterium]